MGLSAEGVATVQLRVVLFDVGSKHVKWPKDVRDLLTRCFALRALHHHHCPLKQEVASRWSHAATTCSMPNQHFTQCSRLEGSRMAYMDGWMDGWMDGRKDGRMAVAAAVAVVEVA